MNEKNKLQNCTIMIQIHKNSRNTSISRSVYSKNATCAIKLTILHHSYVSSCDQNYFVSLELYTLQCIATVYLVKVIRSLTGILFLFFTKLISLVVIKTAFLSAFKLSIFYKLSEKNAVWRVTAFIAQSPITIFSFDGSTSAKTDQIDLYA